MKESSGPMAGVRVVEVSHYVAGPMIGRTLADLGAAVIKIELARHGDGARNNPPFIGGVSASFAVQNLGKKSVCLDLKNPRGAQLAQALAARADVFIENFTPGVLAKYGLSYEELSRLNPRLIMCSVSSYGQLGPYAQQPGNDPVAMALSGVMSVNTHPGMAPVYTGASVTIADGVAGLHGFGAVCTALYHRTVTGKGQFIDVSLAHAMAHINHPAIARYMAGSPPPLPLGSHGTTLCPFGVFKGTGGYIVITVHAHEWERFTQAIGKPELAQDPRYAEQTERMKNQAEVIKIVEDWMQTFPSTAEPLAALERFRINCAPVLDTAGVVTDARVGFQRILQPVEVPGLEPHPYPKTPFFFSDSQVAISGRASLLGEDNERILAAELGISDKELAELAELGVTYHEPMVDEMRRKKLI